MVQYVQSSICEIHSQTYRYGKHHVIGKSAMSSGSEAKSSLRSFCDDQTVNKLHVLRTVQLHCSVYRAKVEVFVEQTCLHSVSHSFGRLSCPDRKCVRRRSLDLINFLASIFAQSFFFEKLGANNEKSSDSRRVTRVWGCGNVVTAWRPFATATVTGRSEPTGESVC